MIKMSVFYVLICHFFIFFGFFSFYWILKVIYVFFSRSFIVLALLFGCITCFELIFVHGELKVVVHSFCSWLSSSVDLPLSWASVGLGVPEESVSECFSSTPSLHLAHLHHGRALSPGSCPPPVHNYISCYLVQALWWQHGWFLASPTPPSILGRSCTPEPRE